MSTAERNVSGRVNDGAACGAGETDAGAGCGVGAGRGTLRLTSLTGRPVSLTISIFCEYDSSRSAANSVSPITNAPTVTPSKSTSVTRPKALPSGLKPSALIGLGERQEKSGGA